MTFTCTIKMDNDAFGEGPATELGRILRQLADNIEKDGDINGSLSDINGNTVGVFEIAA